MPSRTEKFRGSRTHGRGMKAGRGAGLRGGRGNAGLHKHKYISVVKYMPDYFGRHGFKRPPKLAKAKITINVEDICAKRKWFIENGLATLDGKVLVINLTEMGVNKLLGRGQASIPIRVTVEEATPRAMEKITGAGGEVIVEGGDEFTETSAGDDD